MILAKSTNLPLIERLPSVRGRLHAAEPLGRLTWFKVGGAADVFYSPDDAEDLTGFLAECSADIPVIVMGNASNMLVRDGGVRGVVIRLGEKYAEVCLKAQTLPDSRFRYILPSSAKPNLVALL